MSEVDPLIGKSFDRRYEVHERIGKGGMGSVYRATQVSVGREVALKVLAPELAKNPEMVGRFMREAQVASRLKHPNTIVIHDFGQSADGLFIAMELLTGETLYDRLRRLKKLEPMDAISLTKAVLGSLAEAHKARVVHRDVKPDNIFMHRVGELEVVKVLDFGIAKFYQAADQTMTYEDGYETSVGQDGRRPIIGTWHYMAPEQIEDKGVDARADLYALGIVLYEMLAGNRPFQGDSMAAMLRMHLLEPPMPLPGTVPADLALLVHRLLEKNPDKRPQTADEVAANLSRVEHSLKTGAPMMRSSGTRPAYSSSPSGSSFGASYGSSAGEEGSPLVDAALKVADRAGRAARKAWVLHGAAVKLLVAALVVLALIGAGAFWLREKRRSAASARAAAEAAAQAQAQSDAPAQPDTPPPPVEPGLPAPTLTPAVAELPAESDAGAWVVVSPGTFTLGAAGGAADEAPPHEVTLTHRLLVRTSETTQAEWGVLAADNPSHNATCAQCPVENVNWFEAAAWANALSENRGLPACFDLEGCRSRLGQGLTCASAVFKGVECKGYRLPTEAEWEYLAKGAGRPASQEPFDRRVIYAGNSQVTRPVTLAVTEPTGLRGLLGNVWEWTLDVYSPTFYGAGSSVDPTGPGTGPLRVMRGCGYQSPRDECRHTLRRPREPLVVDSAVGFRLVRTLE